MAQDAAFSTLEQGTRAIALNAATLQQLDKLVASTKALRQAGYVVEKLTDHELEKKRRCLTCRVRIGKTLGKQNRKRKLAEAQQPRAQSNDPAASGNATRRGADSAGPKLHRCHFHPGKVISKAWTCCGKHVSEDPCTSKEHHDVQDDGDGTIERRWQFHATGSEARSSHRFAVAIDCEMGTAFNGDTELIRLSVIDYFSGETLIDSLVYPDIAMQHFNTRWSGVTRADMERSLRENKCIMGRDAARRAVFRYVGPSTIVVGHGAQSDLSSLRWIHHRVVDSFTVESARRKAAELKAEQEKKRKEANEPKKGDKPKEADRPKKGDRPKEEVPGNKQKRGKNNPDGMSLKALAMKHLGRAIQVGKKGHDSLEDALAARDLVHAHITGLGNFTR
ncbi:hypothetical protein C8A01DRAFT_16657 [Parachaetomium inaequale]|uniref:Exonuclease domain-containing protein n=1 Tax=Parachaetomium inaequale TaxID=2588326 RepID=A0AAN6PEA7_9PEZI|nr:hypothetical protein C8A01DRAFT_16657 [Parachaetomium inaequale]